MSRGESPRCLICGGRHHGEQEATPKHRSDRNQDSCSLVCQAAYEGGGNCDTYVGRHWAGVRG